MHRIDSLFELCRSHCRPVNEILCASCYLAVENCGIGREIVIHAHIYEHQFESVLSAKHIHTAAIACEVHHLLPSNGTRRHAHTLVRDAVVTGQQQMMWPMQCG